MPDRVNVADVTCPGNTPVGAPVEVFFNAFPPGIPRKVTIVIPDGHAGTTGIALGYGHQPVIPDNTGAFISGNDETIPLDLTNYPAGPQWSAFLMNGDEIPHSWEVRFEFDEIRDKPAPSLITPISSDAILAAGTEALNGG